MKSRQRRPVTLKAARMAGEWVSAFHDKLLDVAQEQKRDAGPINSDDLVRALPIALAELSSQPREQASYQVNVRRRAA